ncbi:MAG: hypothetical protein WB706_06295, partial [Nitrososphaeraceae archaeon]
MMKNQPQRLETRPGSLATLPLTDRTLFLLFRKGIPHLVSVSVIVLNLGLSVGLDLPSRDFFFVVFDDYVTS